MDSPALNPDSTEAISPAPELPVEAPPAEAAPVPVEARRGTSSWMIAVVLLACAAAFWLRTVSTVAQTFTPEGISFQEPDLWYHVRSAQNLAAHFPHRSTFDPYSIFPNGEILVTGPLWDYVLATPAVVAQALTGAPLEHGVEISAVWSTVTLGSLMPLLVFWLGRFLFDDLTGVFAAWWIAWLPGPLLFTSRMAGADHHTAESFLALVALGLLCRAAAVAEHSNEGFTINARVIWLTVASGVALGACYANRPAVIFLVGIIVAAVLLDSNLAALAAVATAVATVLFIPASGGLWSAYTLTSLVFGVLFSAVVAGAAYLWRQKHWTFSSLQVAKFAAVAVGGLLAWALRPAMFNEIFFQVRRSLQSASAIGVGELRPLLQTVPASKWAAMMSRLGTSWLLAFPALAVLFLLAWRVRRPALTLFAVWSAVMIAAPFAQIRMGVYAAVNLSILAAWGSVWLVRYSKRYWVRVPLTGVIVLFIAINLILGIVQLNTVITPTEDWWKALKWLRAETPEPMGDPAAWTRLTMAPPPGGSFPYPASAYSVAVWWDYGYWVEYIARRMPSSNGTQSGVVATGTFYLADDPGTAMRALDRMNAHYVIVDPQIGGADAGSALMSVPNWVHKNSGQFERLFIRQGKQSRVFLPAFYRTMAVRLYFHDGHAAPPAAGVYAIHSHEVTTLRGTYREIDYERKFSSEKDAEAFARGPQQDDYLVGCFDARKNCVGVDEVPGLKLVFATKGAHPVKIFERVKE